MGTRIWWGPEELRAIVAGQVILALEMALANGAINVEHLCGALTMAKGLATALGFDWPVILAQVQGLAANGEIQTLVGMLLTRELKRQVANSAAPALRASRRRG